MEGEEVVGQRQRIERNGGLLYGFAAYGLWGLVPIYFWALGPVPPAEILAHRIVWCALLLTLVLTGLKRWGAVANCLRDRRTLLLLAGSTIFIAINWFVYIYGVFTHRTLQTSLGYFVNPLVSIVLGMVFFRERLRPGQWLAVGLAVCGLVYLIRAMGELPWIALALAFSFGFYGLLRKTAPVDGLIGLAVETLLLLVPAGGCLLFWTATDTGAFAWGRWGLDGMLMLSGLVTAGPLLCFGQAARRLPLSTLGLLQYLAPSLQFLIAVLLFEEPFLPAQRVCFGLTWAALAVLSIESLLVSRWRALPPIESAGDGREESLAGAPGTSS
jgi:chloramphenicol-sensitive protein RarD